MSIPTFEQFRVEIAARFKQQVGGCHASFDEWTINITDSNGVSASARFDFLYRVFVDASVQRPQATTDELYTTVQAAVDAVRQQFSAPPIFNITQLPNALSGIVLRQRCVRPCIDA